MHSGFYRSFITRICKLVLGMMLALSAFVCDPCDVFAQTPEAAMMPEKGEIIGELRRGELLVTALKREKIESGSVTLAIQSLRQLFDTRLCRAGDKYLYRLGNGRKLAMLRYQRGQHVYETTLNPDSNTYETRLLDIPEQLPPIPAYVEPAPGIDPQMDDGEVDVEHAALVPGQNAVEPQNSLDTLNQMDVAQPDDPILPPDPALANLPSPDEEFPERPGFAPDAQDLDDINALPLANGDSVAIDRELHEEDLREDLDSVDDMPKLNPQQQVLPDVSTPIIEPIVPIKSMRVVERESTTVSTISLVMIVLGGSLFLIACLMFVLPSIRVRSRCRKQGLRVLDMLPVAPGMRLLRVQANKHECIIAVYPDNMSFIAPCPPDDLKLWQHIQAKSYWYKMAQNPISDRQLKAIVQAFYEDGGASSDNPVLPAEADKPTVTDRYSTSDVKLTEMPTARAVPDLSDFDDLES